MPLDRAYLRAAEDYGGVTHERTLHLEGSDAGPAPHPARTGGHQNVADRSRSS